MNYFGHAVIAARRRDEAPFVFGSMLPDLAAMLRVRPGSPSDPALAAGVRFHHETDGVFHQTPSFVTWNRTLARTMREQNVSRGPARAAAHIGAEMLIDGVLIERPDCYSPYKRALTWATEHPTSLTELSTSEALEDFLGLAQHLLERGEAIHRTSAERLHFRLERTLEGRRLLEPSAAELDSIVDVLMGYEATIRKGISSLEEELAGLC